ncbi:unnamed protein product [Thlaspi arvense]|uniref:Uncharacterized protein n=1 Tax=Thlaspi arvense TaxID=13288 RepID=A0AAU9RLR2_THLAR|nr:unnamed protein product [Thlaspi arvense]
MCVGRKENDKTEKLLILRNRTEASPLSAERSSTMRRREEKRRKLHEALLQTLYPPSSPPSPSSSPSPAEVADDDPFDVTLINPEDYVNIDTSNHDDDSDNGDDSETAEKPGRAQRKRLRKKMLKEEAARRRKVIGPLLPAEMIQARDSRVADGDGEAEASCLQPARQNAPEKEEKLNFGGNDKTRKVKQRREAKKLARESSKTQDSTSEIS